MKRFTAFTLSTALALTCLAGCGGQGNSSSQQTSSGASQGSAEPTVVTVWHLFPEDEEPTHFHNRLEKWAEEFNATNTDNIKIEVSGGKTADVIQTTIAAGNTPDIFMNYWNNAPTWASAGALYDLTEFVNNDTEFNRDDFLDIAWTLCESEGKTYSVPNTASSTFLFYNKDILAECGWDTFPTTMEELGQCIRDCTKIADDGSIERLGMIPNYPWVDTGLFGAAFGAKFIDENGDITCNSPEMIEAVEWQIDYMKEIGIDKITSFKDGLGARGSAEDPIFTGKLAIRWNADPVLASMEEFGEGKNWAMAPMPGDTGMYTGNVWQMNAKTKDAEAAWKVLASLTGEENMKWLANGDFDKGNMYARKSSLEYLKNEADISENTKYIADYLLTADLSSFPMTPYINEYLDTLGVELATVFTGEGDVKTALDNTAAKVQPLADEYK